MKHLIFLGFVVFSGLALAVAHFINTAFKFGSFVIKQF